MSRLQRLSTVVPLVACNVAKALKAAFGSALTRTSQNYCRQPAMTWTFTELKYQVLIALKEVAASPLSQPNVGRGQAASPCYSLGSSSSHNCFQQQHSMPLHQIYPLHSPDCTEWLEHKVCLDTSTQFCCVLPDVIICLFHIVACRAFTAPQPLAVRSSSLALTARWPQIQLCR